MKSSNLLVALFSASSLLFACGSDTGTSSGSSGSPSSSGSSGSSGKTTSSTETCSSASLNGHCSDGPKKGASCCYAPESADDPPCASSSECSNVCKHCD